jgi:hypothetical protein
MFVVDAERLFCEVGTGFKNGIYLRYQKIAALLA